ncbi:MAG: T9SS type A sorting domain-containing protein [Flavobacteriales bacterium]|nr:T9SS type A sorting domain-containing protein [Flavobacteriales bacterium]
MIRRGVFVFTFGVVAVLCAAQPANDDPCNAVPLVPNVACTNTSGTNVAATATSTVGLPAPGCAGYGGGDLWYQVTLTASGQVTVTTSTNGGFNDSGIAFYTAASCAGPFTLADCDNNGGAGNMSQETYSGAPGTVLWVRVWENGNNSFGTFNICATAPPPPPPNNDPCGALAVSVNTDCSYSNYTNAYATNTGGFTAPGCGGWGGGSLDVWFSFVAPASGIAIIETGSGTLTDAAMALYNDAPPLDCAGPFTLIQCDDNSGPGNMPYMVFNNLTPGDTYYLRVWGNGSASGTFDLCVHGPAVIPATGCVYMLELFDSFGNGWGSSTVDISINGGAFTNYGLTGAYNIILLGLNIGDILVVQYTASGPNQGQNSYELSFFPSGNNLYVSGTTPPAGIVYTQSIDCIPPPAVQQDCVGGATICSSQAFNNTSSNTGNVVDLTIANRGCLAGNERQGTWYYFSPSASGTIGFMIDPSGTDDYDFAVWGPMAAVTCPPPGPPLRCSWALPSGPCPACYNTGCGNGALDMSEGAGGNGWVAPMNVTAGQVYLLYIDNYSTTGQAFNLTWNLTNGASLDCTVLPVELTDFGAVVVEDDVELNWSTASEMNSDHFGIERSRDGLEFELIGTVPAVGNSSLTTHYAFTDRSPYTGHNYYRLRQVDNGGAFEHSHVRTAWIRLNGPVVIMQPNPGSDLVEVVVPAGGSGSILEMLDATGRAVLRQTLDSERTSIDTGALPTGFYAVRLHSSTGADLSRATWIKQ